MKLNRTGSNWTELERNKINENWRIIEGNYNNVVDKVSKEAFEKVVDSAKLNWKEPVDSFADLPSAASEGDTRMARDSGKVYRFNGEMWQEIQQIDAGPVNEVDSRLTAQLAETENRISSEADKTFYNKITLHKRPKACVTIIDDDTNTGLYTKIFPVLKDLNVPITAAAITSTIGELEYRITMEQFEEMRDSGLVEFISHGSTHTKLTEVPLSQVRDILKDSRDWLLKNGGNPDYFVPPYGADNEDIRDLVFEYYKGSFRTFNDGYILTPPLRSRVIRRVEYTPNLGKLKNDLDTALSQNAWIVINTHANYDDFNATDFKELLEYALNIGLDIVTVEEAMRRYGNILEINSEAHLRDRYSGIDANGKPFGLLDSRFYIIDQTNVKFDTPITSDRFPRGASVTHFTSSLANSYGWPAAGTLLTIKVSANYSYQKYYHYHSNIIYYRYWQGDSWSDFVVISGNAMGSSTYIRNLKNQTIGQMIYNQTLQRPVWWTGSKWVFADGTEMV